MPRFSTVPASGCAPVRIITADELGYVKVVESRGQHAGPPQVVARWGAGGKGEGIETMQVTSSGPCGGLITVARTNQTVDLLDIASGQPRASLLATPPSTAGNKPDLTASLNPLSHDVIRGVHLFQQPLENAARLLTCSRGGNVSLRRVPLKGDDGSLGDSSTVAEWGVGSGVERTAVDGKEQVLAVGGKGLDVTLWDLETRAKLWQAKNTRPDVMGLQTPIWVTQISLLGGDRNRILAATGHHQLRLYDVKAQRRPIMVMEFGELPIWSIAEDPSGHVVYAGNSSGDIASFDLRTGAKSGGFVGAVSGSVRSLAVHPTEPLLASVGLDRFLRIHSTATRKLQAKVFLKQQMVACAFDTDPARQPEEAEPQVEEEDVADDDDRPMRHVAASASRRDDDSGEEEEMPTRKKGGDEKRRKAQKIDKAGKKDIHENDEGAEEDGWGEFDEEEDSGVRKRGPQTDGRKKERKRRKGPKRDDEDSGEEGASGKGFGGEVDGDSDGGEELPRKKRKSQGKGPVESGKMVGRSKGKGVDRGAKRGTSKGKTRGNRKRT